MPAGRHWGQHKTGPKAESRKKLMLQSDWEWGEEGKRPVSAAGLQQGAASGHCCNPEAPLQPRGTAAAPAPAPSQLDVLPRGTAGRGGLPGCALCPVLPAAAGPARAGEQGLQAGAWAGSRSLSRQQHLGNAPGGSGSVPAGVSPCSTCTGWSSWSQLNLLLSQVDYHRAAGGNTEALAVQILVVFQ